jgi:hypothetical protein
MKQKIARWDLRSTSKWAEKNKARALIVSLFLSVGGIASVMGMLRIDVPVLNWSLALFFWGIATFLISCTFFGRNDA